MGASIALPSMLPKLRYLYRWRHHQLWWTGPFAHPRWCPSCTGPEGCTASQKRNPVRAGAQTVAPKWGGTLPAVRSSWRPSTDSWRRSPGSAGPPWGWTRFVWGGTWPRSGYRAWTPSWYHASMGGTRWLYFQSPMFKSLTLLHEVSIEVLLWSESGDELLRLYFLWSFAFFSHSYYCFWCDISI